MIPQSRSCYIQKEKLISKFSAAAQRCEFEREGEKNTIIESARYLHNADRPSTVLCTPEVVCDFWTCGFFAR